MKFELVINGKLHAERHLSMQCMWFLVACKRFYNSLCRSVSWSVGPSVLRSVTRLSGGALSSNSSETAWTFPTPFYRMNIDSPRMVYVYFHRPIYHRDFSMTVLLKIIYGQDTYSVMYFGVCLTSWHLCPASSEFSFLAIGQILPFLLSFLWRG